VQKGWQGANEVDRVVYDPEVISVPEMENILREAGTYRKTLFSSARDPERQPEQE
jgi:hypothetical protein